jgi:hypothetical protein
MGQSRQQKNFLQPTDATTKDKRATADSTYPKGGVSFPFDSFMVNETFVYQMKFCGKSPALRVAAKR